MEIDVIIEKAKLIKEADNPEGIDNLIKSLESYKANKGDIRKKRIYNFLFGVCENGSMWWRDVEAQLYGLTTNIVKRLNECYSRKFRKMAYENYHLAGYVIDSDDEIYDYVFDVEFYEVSHELEVLLYKHNFDTICDFDGINEYRVYVSAGIKERAYIVDNFSSMSDYSVIGVDPSTICQFTGLKDCEGKEIWEGDIVEREIYDLYKGFVKAKAVIEYSVGAFVAMVNIAPYPLYSQDVKVVGNKFDRKVR